MAQRKKSNKKQDDVLLDLSKVGGRAEDFFEKYQKQILLLVGGIALLVGGWFAYTNLYKKPKQKEALEQMAQAEWQFERDSFNLALANPGGGYPGFAEIVKKYGATDAGNAACYYAGICCLNQGQFDAAIDYLEDYSGSGKMLPAKGALADAYAEKGNLDKALSLYKSAAGASDNETLTPYYLKKVAMLSEKLGKADAAKDAWQKIKTDYPTAPEAKDAEKKLVSLN